MKKPSEPDRKSSLRDKIIGLGERSIRKSYYPQLQKHLEEVEEVRKELDQSRALYRSLVENINDVIFSLDTEGVITYISPVIQSWSGFVPEELIGKSFKDFIHPEDLPSLTLDFKSALAGDLKPQEFRLIVKDGGVRQVRTSSRPLQENGQVLGLTGVMIDITEAKQAMKQLRESLVGTIRAISLVVEKRDPYTAGHQNKVSKLCVAIGSELGWNEDRIEGLRLGAIIHDIGKIYVPAEILNRPGKLTDNEFALIKEHPQIGYEFVKDIDFPWPVAKMILQHHERLDGSGYPNGTNASEMISEARIIAVADVVEAMMSHRPYRPAIGIELALQEIESNRGTKYDAEVVNACLRLFRDRGFVLE